MALLYIDEFENGAAGVNVDAVPNSSLFGMTVTVDKGHFRIVDGYLSGKTIRGSFDANRVSKLKLFESTGLENKIVVGFAFAVSQNSDKTASGLSPIKTTIFGFDGVASSYLYLNPDWSLSIGELTTQPNILSDSVFSYIEIEFNQITGVFELWVNNLSVGTGSIILSGKKHVMLGRIISAYGAYHFFYDDIYILDDSGTIHNQRLGPVRAVRVPFNSTTGANFTPFGAADNITAINKDAPNTSTFNRSPAANNVGDYFKLDTSVLPSDRPIIAVQQSAMYRKTDIGERALKLVAKEGADRKEHLLPERLATFSGGPAQILETAADGSAWDLTNLAATDFGYEVAP